MIRGGSAGAAVEVMVGDRLFVGACVNVVWVGGADSSVNKAISDPYSCSWRRLAAGSMKHKDINGVAENTQMRDGNTHPCKSMEYK